MKVPAQPMHHPILGDLAQDKRFPDTLVGQVPFEAAFIKLSIAPDGDPIEGAVGLAVATVNLIKVLDAKARKLIAIDSLEGYNTDWRLGETILPNGQTEPFEKPVLTEDEFCRNLKFEAMEVTGPNTLTFWYADSDMFWGHSLYVTSFDGVAMKDTHVSMFG